MHRIGVARATTNVYGSALARFNDLQIGRSDPVFSELEEDHVANDNLKKLLVDYATYLVKTNLHAFNNPKNKGIAASCKNQYLSKTKEDLKANFPDHDAWKNEEQWYPQLRKELEHGVTRTKTLDPDIA